ncbi:hypothetical protein FF011L_50270 [Roseimaritima multifibrata]|uniref:Uncharacterized protein n=1 Tax=Roseimaritima multifibrata TaxID=1930274 RepID=A0A517MMV6_9BACT|nr:hypothetical protein [Roseimaritima multifibrata]QDS96219.1 hypothetical protein FF011L_50270 [Roseimaritima multifibrata]
MTYLIVFAVILLVVTLVGHVIWISVAFVLRGLFGSSASIVERPVEAADPRVAQQRDLFGYKRVVDALTERGRLDAAESDRLHDLGREQASLVFPDSPISASLVQDQPASSADKPFAATSPIPLRPSPANQYPAGVHPLDQEEPPVAAVPVVEAGLVAGAAQVDRVPPPPARRAFAEILSHFLVAHNIRWGELIAGLLIVFCSIGLVISLWSPLTETHRLLPSLVFLGGTLAIEGAGLYTLKRWRLRQTSRAVLTIASLLIPLSVVTGMAVASAGETPVRLGDPATLGFVFVGAICYLVALWLAGKALVRQHNTVWWMVAIGAPTMVLPAVPALLRQFGMNACWGLIGVSSLVALAIVMLAGRRSRRGEFLQIVRPVAGWNLLLVFGVGLYAMLVLVGFLVLQVPRTATTFVLIAVAITPLGLAGCGMGWRLRRSTRKWQAFAGVAIALTSMLLLAGIFPAVLGQPRWLLAWGVLIAVPAVLMAFRLRIDALLGVAAMAVGASAMLLFPWWMGDQPWGRLSTLWWFLLTDEALWLATLYGVGLLLLSRCVSVDTGQGRPAALANLPVVPSLKRTSWSFSLAVAGAFWLVSAVVLAVACAWLGWSFASLDRSWPSAVGVLGVIGLIAIMASVVINKRPHDAHRQPLDMTVRRYRLWMLRIGQLTCLLAIGFTMARLLPDRLIGLDAIVDGDAAWWWIGALAAYGLVWNLLRGTVRKVFPLRLSGGFREWTPDIICGGIAFLAIGVLGILAVVRLVLAESGAGEYSLVMLNEIPLLPAVAMAIVSAWVVSYCLLVSAQRQKWISLLAWSFFAGMTWWFGWAFADRPDRLLWIGSALIVLTSVLLTVAWWIACTQRNDFSSRKQMSREPVWKAFVSQGTIWGGLVVTAFTCLLLINHLPWFGDQVSSDGSNTIAVLVGWGVVAILGFSIASVVLRKEIMGAWAAVLVPFVAYLTAVLWLDDGWQQWAVIGWGILLAVALQRLAVISGLVRQIERHSLREVSQPSTPDTGNLQLATKYEGAWPLPVQGLTTAAFILAVAFAVICIPWVWFEPFSAGQNVSIANVSFVGAALLLGRWLGKRTCGLGINASNLVILLWSPVIALAIGRGWVGAADAKIWLLGGFSLSAVCDAVMVHWDSKRIQDWWAAVLKGGVVAGVAWSLMPNDDMGMMFGLVGCVVLHQTGSLATLFSNAAGAAKRLSYGVGQLSGCAGVLAGCLYCGWYADGTTQALLLVFVWTAGTLLLARLSVSRPLPNQYVASEPVGLILAVFSLVGVVLAQFADMPATEVAWGIAGVAVLGTSLIAVSTVLRIGRPLQVEGAFLLMMASIVLIADAVQPALSAERRLALPPLAVGFTLALFCWAWPLRQILRKQLMIWGLGWNATEDQNANLRINRVIVMTAGGLFLFATYAAWEEPHPMTRYFAIAAVFLAGWALATIATGVRYAWLRTATVLLFVGAFLLLAIAIPHQSAFRELVVVMRMLVVGIALLPLFGWLVPRTMGLADGDWKRPLRVGAGAGLTVAVIALVAMFGLELMARDDGSVESLPRALVLGIAGLLAATCVAVSLLALRRNDPEDRSVLPILSPEVRRAAIYAAQIIGFLTWLHLYLCKSPLATIGLRAYWPFVVMGLAFFSVAIVEWARRRKDTLLAGTLRQSSLLLPLVPAVGYWVGGANSEWLYIGGQVDYAVLLAVAGIYYIGVSIIWPDQRWPKILGVLLGNAALWVGLTQSEFWGFWEHPQLWLIPPAICVLMAAHLERKRLKPALLAGIRYSAMLVIYVSSTADMLLQEIGQTIWGPIFLVVLAMLGVLCGVLLRVRSFLYLGTFFILVGVLSMVWHAQAALDRTWPWWAFGIGSGILILVGLTMIEKQKKHIKRLTARLGEWES